MYDQELESCRKDTVSNFSLAMNVTNVFGKKMSLDYQTRAPQMMYSIHTEFESVADTQPVLTNSSIPNDNVDSFGNFIKAPLSGVYHNYDSSLNGFYQSNPDHLQPYFSAPNELNFQPNVFQKQFRSCQSLNALTDTFSSSQEIDLQGTGWPKLSYSSLSYNSCLSKKNLFRPIKSRVSSPYLEDSSPLWTEEHSKDVVELVVSNLDYNISSREWKEILYSTFHSAVMVINVVVRTQSDNSNLGFVRVPTIEDARFAISQFHRKKIGYKRIHVALKTEECKNSLSNVKNEVISILKEAKGYVLPLFKFIEQFDRRYHRSISVSELYKMKDVLEIREQGGAGRMVHLTASYSITLSNPDPEVNVNDPPICPVHCPEDANENIEALDCQILPNVYLSLKTFTPQVHTLLQKHDGNLPLISFPTCYAAEFEPLKITEKGVNLEHLISCVSEIKIYTARNGVKKIQWEEKPQILSSDCLEKNGSDSSHLNLTSTLSGSTLTQQLCQISREVVDLLKHIPQCSMAFSKFIPAYHHHFGRQCRVADYGYTKLIELFEAIPHVLQILGTGEKKSLTLSRKAQVRRFTSDLLRVLKVRTNKIISLSELPSAYLKVMEKPWDITEYGVCEIEDILSEISSGTIQVSEDSDPVLSIPRREQTPAEIARTKQFSREVVDLLKHNPLCEMTFNKFIPSYHHHFGRQCRVADYGFVKLIELFEAIPHVVAIDEEGEERMLRLTKPERLRLFSVKINDFLQASPDQMLLLSELEETFNDLYNSPLESDDLSIQEVLSMLQYQFQVEVHGGQKFVVMKSASSHCPTLARQIVPILMAHCSTGAVWMLIEELSAQYTENYTEELDCSELPQLFDYLQVFDGESLAVSLSPLQEFAQCMRSLLDSYGSIPFSNFESVFHEYYGIEVKPALYNLPDVFSVLLSISNVVVIKGKVNKRLFLVEDLNGDAYSDDSQISNHLQETICPPSENYQNESILQDNSQALQLTQRKPEDSQRLTMKPKSKKAPLVRTSKITETPVNNPRTKSNVQLTYSATNSRPHLNRMSLNRYNSVDGCREGWSLVHPQLSRTNPWQNGHLTQTDPVITRNQMNLNGMAAPYPTGYWQPAYPGAPASSLSQAYNSQSNLCPGMQNLHYAFTNVPMSLNSQYSSGESLQQYQPVHSAEHDFMHGHFSYESLFHEGSPVGTSSLVNSPKKMQSLNSQGLQPNSTEQS